MAQFNMEAAQASDKPPSGRAAVSDDEPPPATLVAPATNIKPSIQTHNRWNDWRWQMSHRIRAIEQLFGYFPDKPYCQSIEPVIAKYPMAITPYYASLIRKVDLFDPVFQMSVPQLSELHDPPFLSSDPLEENDDMPVAGLVHRYPDRALLIATSTCSMYCRHCTRKRVAGTREMTISARRLEQVTAYLTAHPEISDVIVSGGDPLTMSDESLEMILSALRKVQSVQIIRIGTRMPVVLPMRITDALVNMLKKYHPLWVNTHFNHPNEITPDSIEACRKLADAGIPLGNQSVLLRNVNDNPKVYEQLCRALVRMRVRPYYLYQCDLVRGIEHFRTPVSRGIEIMEYLRGRVSGLAIPTFVVDALMAVGKSPFCPAILFQPARHIRSFATLKGC
jgi:lysine 2,3-aminomutase